MNAAISTPAKASETRRTTSSLPGSRARVDAGYRPAAGTESREVEREEEMRLAAAAQAGDRRALERLVKANTPLVYRIARRYHCRSYSLEDLVQEGTVGLMLAIERFDVTRGYRLATYASHWIRQTIARAVQQNDRLIHLPLQASAELRQLRRVREEQERSLGRPPSEDELAAAAGIPEDRVADLMSTVQDALSLEAMVGESEETSILDLSEDPSAADPEEHALCGLHRQYVHHLVAGLGPRERWVLEERFGLASGTPRTLEDLSRQLRISRERVRQIEARAIARLRRAIRLAQWD